MRKNEIAVIEITGYTAEGNGVGRLDGMAVFVPGAAVGDTLQVRIVKTLKNYAFGKIEELVVPSKRPDHTRLSLLFPVRRMQLPPHFL